MKQRFHINTKILFSVFLTFFYFISHGQRYESVITIGLDGGQMFSQPDISGESIVFLGYGFNNNGNCTLQSGEQGTLLNYNVCDRDLVFPVFTDFVTTQTRLRSDTNPFASGIFGRLDAQTSIPLKPNLQNAGSNLFSVNYNTSISNFNFCQNYQAFGSNTGTTASITIQVLELGKNIRDLNPQYVTDNTIACDDNITLTVNECGIGFHYALEYQIRDSSGIVQPWSEALNYSLRSSPTLSVTDYFSNLDSGQLLDIRLRYSENLSNDTNDYSDILTFTYTDCSPGLVIDPPTALAPLCANPDNTGSVIVEFDRELASNERMNLYIEIFDPLFTTPDQFDFYDGIILDSNDINVATSNTYTWDSILSPGRYRLRWISKSNPTDTEIAEMANSDEMSSDFFIVAPPEVNFTHSSTQILCNGEKGSIIINGSGGSGTGYEYSINNGASWQPSTTFSGLDPNIQYDLLAMDGNGCISTTTAQITLTEPDQLILDLAGRKDPTSNGATDGFLTIDVFGGTGAVTYQWTKDGTNYATTQSLTDLGAGLYTVIATDANGCSSNTLEFTLQDPPALSITFSVIQTIDCNGNTGSIRAQGVGGNNASYTYLWQDGTTSQDFLNKPAGTYSVTVADANNVEFTDSFSLTEPDLLVATPTSNDVLCNGGSDGTLDLNITGGFGSYTISWNDDATITTEQRTGLAQGEYFYTIVDTNSCSINGSVIINQPNPIEIVIDSTQDPTIVGATDGFINITVSEGTAGYTFVWTNDAGDTLDTTEDIAGLGDGNYTLTVTDANFGGTADNSGCTASISVRLTEPQPLSASINETTPISCFGDSDGVLTANPIGGTQIPSIGYTYQWFKDNNGTFETLNLTTQAISDLTIGTYRVIATDDIGTVAQADFTLSQPDVLDFSFTTQQVRCYGGSDGSIDSTPAGGTAPYTFVWTNSAGDLVGSDEDLVGVPSGNYTLTLVDINLCTASQTIEILAPTDPLSITVDQTGDPTAAGATDGFINVSISGGTAGYAFEWIDSAGTTIATSEDLSGVSEGVYTLTVTDANSGSTTDNSGCTVFEDIPLLAPDAIVITIDETSSLLCNGDGTGELTATVTGGFLNTGSDYTYQWFIDNSGSLDDINQNIAVATNLSIGSYTLRVTDDNGIIKEEIFNLNEPDSLAIDLTVTSDVSCDSGADGAISSIVSGGTAPYTYNWNNGATTADITDLTVNTYILTITDANDCAFSQSIEVTQPGGMVIENSVTPPLCFGSSDANITLTISGGNSPYAYLWNTGATTATINNLIVGNYSVTITDNEGCKVLQNFTVENPELLTLNIGEDRVLCAGQSLTIDATIDDTGASYNWSSDTSFSSSSPIVDLLDEGTYTLTITNTNGCIATDTIAINTTNEVISADFLVSTQAFVDETIVAIDVSDPLPDTVTWSFSEGTTIVTHNGDYAELKFAQEGVYTITMTTTKGSCQESLSKEITVLPRTNTNAQQDQQTAFIKTFNLYPNPTNGIFNAKVELKQKAPISIKVINLSSNIVQTVILKEPLKEYLIDYNMNHNPGTYIMLLETPKGIATKKFVVY